MPNQPTPPDPTPALEALLVNHDKHASTHTSQNDSQLDVLKQILAILQQMQSALPQPAINTDAPPATPSA